MRKILQYSLKLIVVCTLFITLTSCKQQVTVSMSLGEWLDTIVNALKIEVIQQQKPYFINVGSDSPYFDAVQKSVDWGIISVDVAIDPEKELTKEWCAATLVKLAQLQESNATFNDANKSQFSDLIQTSINFGLFTLDSRGCFNPKQIMEKEEALRLLDKTINYIDTKDYDSVTEFEFNDVPIEPLNPIEFNDKTQTAIVSNDVNVKKDTIVTINDAKDGQQLYQVNDVIPSANPNNGETYQEVTLGPVDYFEVIEEGEIVYDEPINFDDTIIEFENDASITPVSFSNSVKTHQKTFDGFTVKSRFSGSNITIDVTKKLENNLTIVGNLKVFNIKPIVIWKTNEQGIEHTKLELRFDSLQAGSLRYEPYNMIKEADLKDINKDNFIEKLTRNYKTVTSLTETLIPIATIKIPIGNMPSITLAMQLYVRIGTDGRMEIKIVNDHCIGFEIKNNCMRFIQKHNHDVDASLSASAFASAGIKLGLNAWNMELMDVGSDAGVKAKGMLIVHLYDDNQNHTKETIGSMDSSLASTLSTSVDGVLTCLDLSAHYMLNLTFNSSNTVLSKLGFYKRFDLLNRDNAPLFNGLTLHLEDGIKVDKCTRGSKTIHKVDKDPLQNYQKITLKKYSYVLDKDSKFQLEIKGIPNDITFQDLRYSSSDTSIATINQQGVIEALKEGACHIVIQDKESKYKTTLNIVVRMVV